MKSCNPKYLNSRAIISAKDIPYVGLNNKCVTKNLLINIRLLTTCCSMCPHKLIYQWWMGKTFVTFLNQENIPLKYAGVHKGYIVARFFNRLKKNLLHVFHEWDGFNVR